MLTDRQYRLLDLVRRNPGCTAIDARNGAGYRCVEGARLGIDRLLQFGLLIERYPAIRRKGEPAGEARLYLGPRAPDALREMEGSCARKRTAARTVATAT